MPALKITGGIPLCGEIQIEANKNAVLPSICATVAIEEWCVLTNTPKSPDVLKLLQAITELGGEVIW